MRVKANRPIVIDSVKRVAGEEFDTSEHNFKRAGDALSKVKSKKTSKKKDGKSKGKSKK